MAEVGYVDEDTQPIDVFAEERKNPEVDPKPVPETPEVEPGQVDEPGETPAVEPGPVDDPEGDDDDD